MQDAITKGKSCALLCALPGAGNHLPKVPLPVRQQQKLHTRAGVLLGAVEAGWQYARIVENQTIARL